MALKPTTRKLIYLSRKVKSVTSGNPNRRKMIANTLRAQKKTIGSRKLRAAFLSN